MKSTNPILSVPTQRRRASILRAQPQLTALAVAGCFALTAPAWALPSGANVVAGQATMTQSGNSLNVVNTPGAIINWANFSVGALESVRFQQQSALSSVLNRVTGEQTSAIYGTLASNGRVWLINPNGILFGAGARIDVNGLIASTLNISNSDFLAGKLNFNAGALAGSIKNEGTLQANGGNIYLVSPDIENSGIVRAPGGEVMLAAGHQVSLVDNAHPDVQVVVSAPGDKAVNLGEIVTQNGRVSLFGALLQQKGKISADAVEVDSHGRIVFRGTQKVELTAGSTTSASGSGNGGEVSVRNSGDTYVSGAVSATGSSGQGGQIELLGDRVAVMDRAAIDASGDSGGGRILVGGDFQGKNADVPNSRITYFGPDATLKADALKVGAGGTAIVWADDVTRAYGSISARGGSVGGDGGLVETSGKWLDVNGIWVDAGASQGAAGTWLLDPIDITIQNGSDTNINSSGAPAVFQDDGATNGILTPSTIVSALSGTNVTVQASGSITVSNGITETTTPSRTLKLHADSGGGGAGGITLNAPISLANTSNLSLKAGTSGVNSNGANILVGGLEVVSDGSVLIAGANQVSKVAANVTGAFSFENDATALSIGTVGTTSGITATGNINVQQSTSGGIAVDKNVASSSGSVAITVASGSGGIAFATPAAVTVSGTGVSISTSNGNITQTNALTVTDSGTTSFNAGTGTITLDNSGNDFGTVSLTGGPVSIRDTNALALYSVSAAAFKAQTGGALTQTNSISATSLEVISAGGAILNGNNSVTTVAGNISSGDFSFANSDSFTVGTLNTTVGVTATTGNITLKAGHSQYGALTLANPVAATAGNVTYIADSIAFNANTTTPTTSGKYIEIYPYNIGSSISFDNTTADTPGSTLTLSATELGTLTTNLLKVGNSSVYGGIGFVDAVSGGANFSNLSLITGGAGEITQTGGTITVTGLNADGYAGVTLNQANSVSNLQGHTSSAAFAFTNAGAINIAQVDAGNSSGIVSNSGVTLVAGGAVTQSAGALLSTTGMASITAVGGITLNAANMAASASLTNTGSGNIGYHTSKPSANASASNVGTGTISLTNDYGGGVFIVNSATTGSGSITLASSGDLTLSDTDSNGLVTTTGAVTITSSAGQILDGNGNANANVNGSTISLTAYGGIPTVNTGTTTLSVNPSTELNATSATGSIILKSPGDMKIGVVSAPTGSVSLTAVNSIIDNNSTTVNITAPSITLTSSSGASNSSTLAISADILQSSTNNLIASVSNGSAYGGISIRNASTSAWTPTSLSLADSSSYGGTINGLSSTGVHLQHAGDLAPSAVGIGTGMGPNKVMQVDVAGSLTLSGSSSISAGSAVGATQNAYVKAGQDISVSGFNSSIYGGDVYLELKGANSNLVVAGGGKIGATSVNTVHINFTSRTSGGLNISTYGGGGLFSAGSSVTAGGPGTVLTYAAPAVVPSLFLVNTKLSSGSASHIFGDNPDAVFDYELSPAKQANEIISGTAVFTPTITSLTPAGTLTVSYYGGLTSSIPTSTFTAGTGYTYTVNPRILKAITSTLTGTISKLYDGTTLATLAPGNFLLTGFASGDSATVNQTVGTYSSKNVGTGITVTASLAESNFSPVGTTKLSNYILPTSASGSIGEIKAVELTVSGLTASSKVYDGTTSATLAGSPVLAGVIGNEVVTVSTGSGATFADKNVGSNKSVSLAGGLTLGGADAQNYVLKPFTSALSANITAAQLSLSGLSVSNKVYDGTTNATLAGSPVLTGVFGSDQVTVATGTASFVDKNVGQNKPVNLSGGASLGGADAANYILSPVATSLSANITTAELTLSGLSVSNKVYDGTTKATLSGTPVLTGVFGNDTVTVSTGTASFADKNAGDNKPVTLSGAATLGGADAPNYVLKPTTTALSANITKAELTLSGLTVQSKVYDGSTKATLASNQSLSGVYGGDVVTVSAGTASFADRHVGDNKTVTLSDPVTIGGADAINYILKPFTASLTASITPLASVAWVGGSGNWSDATNWAGGALPDRSNVRSVSIPAGASVTFDSNAILDSLSNAGNLTLASSGLSAAQFSLTGGSFAIGSAYTMKSLQLSGGTVSGGNLTITENIAKSGGTIAIDGQLAINQASGNLSIVNSAPLKLGNISAPGGDIYIETTGGLETFGAVVGPGAIDLLTHSPLTIGSGGISAGGRIALTAGSAAGGPTDNMTINGALAVSSSSGGVSLVAGRDIAQNAAISTAGGGVSAQAQTGSLSVSAPISVSGGGSVALAAGQNIAQSAAISTVGGNVSASATSGSVTMTSGASTSSGGGSISYAAAGNITLARLDAGPTGAVTLTTAGNIGTASGFSGTSVVGGTLSMNAGGSAVLDTEVKSISGDVKGTTVIRDPNLGTIVASDETKPGGSQTQQSQNEVITGTTVDTTKPTELANNITHDSGILNLSNSALEDKKKEEEKEKEKDKTTTGGSTVIATEGSKANAKPQYCN